MARIVTYRNLTFMRSPDGDYVESFLNNRNSALPVRFIQGEKQVSLGWGYQFLEFPHADRDFAHAYLTKTETWVRNGVQTQQRITRYNRYHKTPTGTGTIGTTPQSITYDSPTSGSGPGSLINETYYVQLSDPWHVADVRALFDEVFANTPDPQYTTYKPGNPPVFRQDRYSFDTNGNLVVQLDQNGRNFPYPSVKYFMAYFAVSPVVGGIGSVEMIKSGTLINNLKYCIADYSAYRTDPLSRNITFTPARNCATFPAVAQVNVSLDAPPITLSPMPELGFTEYRWLFYPGYVPLAGEQPPVAPCCQLT